MFFFPLFISIQFFSPLAVASHYASKGLPDDRAGRMLSHYLDVEAYQEQRRSALANPQAAPKPKLTKKQIEAFKQKKIDKQRRRILEM
jgi:hypothetical protein